MDITHLIAHPEELNQETLYDLRRLVAVHPTYHAARILFLQNLFILHDSTFDMELRRAALLVPDRRVLFAMTQTLTNRPKAPQRAMVTYKETDVAASTKVAETQAAPETLEVTTPAIPAAPKGTPKKKYPTPDTTSKLLNDFLSSTPQPLPKKHIKADPSTDYMTFLMQQEEREESEVQAAPAQAATEAAEAPSTEDSSERLFSLIDSFIASQEEGITLSEDPMIPEGILDDEEELDELPPSIPETDSAAQVVPAAKADSATRADSTAKAVTADKDKPAEKETVTQTAAPQPPTGAKHGVELSETLAQIYIKQQKYERAIEVLNKINTNESTAANPYLADQVRFLQKLALINSKKSTKSK